MPPTTIDHENSGTRSRVMPGARRVSTVVTTQTVARHSAAMSTANAAWNRFDAIEVAPEQAAVHRVRREDESAGQEPQPERGGGRPGEGDGSGADLEGHDGDRDAEQQRHEEQEHGADGVQRVHLREAVAAQHVERADLEPLGTQERRR